MTVCILKSFPEVNWWRPEGVGQLSPRTHFSYSVMAWPSVFEVRAMILPPWGSISYGGSLGPSCPWGGGCCDQFKPVCNHIRPLPPALGPVLTSWVEDVWKKFSQSAYVLNSLFCNHVFRVPLRWNGLFLKCWWNFWFVPEPRNIQKVADFFLSWKSSWICVTLCRKV